MKQLALPARFENLEKVDNLVVGWENVKLAIRPDCRDEVSLDKAKTAIEAGLMMLQSIIFGTLLSLIYKERL